MPDTEREIVFRPGFDRRDEKNGGCHGTELLFVLRRPDIRVALVATVLTGWLRHPYRGSLAPIHAPRPLKPRSSSPGVEFLDSPSGGAVSLHSRELLQPDHWDSGMTVCPWLGDKPCWGTHSYIMGNRFLEQLVETGSDGAWQWMEETLDEWLTPDP